MSASEPPLTIDELRAPVIARAARRLAVYATFPGNHLEPLNEAYPEGSVDEAQARLKRDALALVVVLNAVLDLDLGLEVDL